MDALGSADILEFGRFRFDRSTHTLFRLEAGKSTVVPLGRTALDVLGVLVERQGEVAGSDLASSIAFAGRALDRRAAFRQHER